MANQQNKRRDILASFRVIGRQPELYDAVTDDLTDAREWRLRGAHTQLTVRLEPNASVFVIFRKSTRQFSQSGKNWPDFQAVQTLDGPWQVQFDPASGGPSQPRVFDRLTDWSQSIDSSIRYYSGTATYTKSFTWPAGAESVPKSVSSQTNPTGTSPRSENPAQRIYLDLGRIANIADVKLNGMTCGIVWTAPNRVELTKLLKAGENKLTIEVSNTWANRLIGDQFLPESKRITRTTAPFRLQGKALQEAGLLGPIRLMKTSL